MRLLIKRMFCNHCWHEGINSIDEMMKCKFGFFGFEYFEIYYCCKCGKHKSFAKLPISFIEGCKK